MPLITLEHFDSVRAGKWMNLQRTPASYSAVNELLTTPLTKYVQPTSSPSSSNAVTETSTFSCVPSKIKMGSAQNTFETFQIASLKLVRIVFLSCVNWKIPYVPVMSHKFPGFVVDVTQIYSTGHARCVQVSEVSEVCCIFRYFLQRREVAMFFWVS